MLNYLKNDRYLKKVSKSMNRLILLCALTIAVVVKVGCQSVGWRIESFKWSVIIPVPIPVPYMIEDNANDLNAPLQVQPAQAQSVERYTIEPVWKTTEGIESEFVFNSTDYSLLD